jgi:cytochrome c oxidase cbb3-type subunit 3
MDIDNKDKTQEQGYEIDTLTNERLLADHEYDGIQELDNDLPPWWKWLFYITIVFGVVYLIKLWVFNSEDLDQNKEFEKEMAQVASLPSQQADAASFEIKVLTDDASIASGKDIYDKNCAVCHTPDGGGLVGPNFTDDYWIHGNSMDEMFKIVTNGVLEKGMTPFKDQLSPTKRLEVLSYIITLHGTTPANPKAPEGEKMDWPY